MKRIIALLLAALLGLGAAALAEGESLWGKNAKLEVVPLPDEAIDEGLEAPFVAGMSADGQKLLVAGFNGSPYLWDSLSGERLYLTAGDAATDAMLELCSKSEKLPEDQLRILREKYADAPGDARLAMTMDEAFFGAARANMAQGASGDYLEIFNARLNYAVLIDCRTGVMRMPEEGMPVMPVVDGAAVAMRLPDAFLWNVETGGETRLDLGRPDWMVKAARLLPDGSVCGVLEDRSTLDKVNGQETVLAILAPDGSREEYPLGRYLLGRAPDTLLVGAGGRRLVLFSAMAVAQSRPLMIDRDAGETSLLLLDPAGGLAATPLHDCMDDKGMVSGSGIPYSDIVYIPLAEMNDGTLLALDMNANALRLLDLDALGTWTLVDDAGMADLASYRMALLGSLPPLTGNGLDCFTLRGQDVILRLTAR